MSVTDFYHQLSPYYHLIYPDWPASIRLQGAQIDSVIRELWPGARILLDAACGAGTQAIGLTELGYAVAASDITPAALGRAKQETAARSLAIDFALADLRTLSSVHSRRFDVVIACDNAIPHLLSDDEIRTAFREMHRCTAPGGGALISVRDYDPAQSTGTRIVPYGVRTEGERRYLVFQVWEFHGPIYDLSMYFVEDGRFERVRRIDDRFFQPLIVGFKPGR